jgi:hypothetical protein
LAMGSAELEQRRIQRQESRIQSILPENYVAPHSTTAATSTSKKSIVNNGCPSQTTARSLESVDQLETRRLKRQQEILGQLDSGLSGGEGALDPLETTVRSRITKSVGKAKDYIFDEQDEQQQELTNVSITVRVDLPNSRSAEAPLLKAVSSDPDSDSHYVAHKDLIVERGEEDQMMSPALPAPVVKAFDRSAPPPPPRVGGGDGGVRAVFRPSLTTLNDDEFSESRESGSRESSVPKVAGLDSGIRSTQGDFGLRPSEAREKGINSNRDGAGSIVQDRDRQEEKGKQQSITECTRLEGDDTARATLPLSEEAANTADETFVLEPDEGNEVRSWAFTTIQSLCNYFWRLGICRSESGSANNVEPCA